MNLENDHQSRVGGLFLCIVQPGEYHHFVALANKIKLSDIKTSNVMHYSHYIDQI